MGCATIVRLSVLVVAAFGASTVHADGVCEKGMRDTTTAERQTMMRVMEAAKAALPLAPEGWVIGGYEDELRAIDSICRDVETTPWAYALSRAFNRTDDAAQREQAMADAGAAARAAQQARQPRMDALQAKMQALSAEFATAAQSGDQERIAASQRAMDAVSAEYAAFFAAAEDPQLLQTIARATMQDRTMSIEISVNPDSISDSDLHSVTPLGGAQSAYRATMVDEGVETARVILLYGSWQPRAGGMTSSRRGTASSSAAHAIAVRVEADPARLDSLLGSIDLNAIAALTR